MYPKKLKKKENKQPNNGYDQNKSFIRKKNRVLISTQGSSRYLWHRILSCRSGCLCLQDLKQLSLLFLQLLQAGWRMGHTIGLGNDERRPVKRQYSSSLVSSTICFGLGQSMNMYTIQTLLLNIYGLYGINIYSYDTFNGTYKNSVHFGWLLGNRHEKRIL